MRLQCFAKNLKFILTKGTSVDYMPKLALRSASLKTARKRIGHELPPISSCKPGEKAGAGNVGCLPHQSCCQRSQARWSMTQEAGRAAQSSSVLAIHTPVRHWTQKRRSISILSSKELF